MVDDEAAVFGLGAQQAGAGGTEALHWVSGVRDGEGWSWVSAVQVYPGG